jgi:3'(2'), 5'-bisphosphate nucleotidase
VLVIDAATLNAVAHIARAAGCAAMRYYGRTSAQSKADSSPVTLADHAANNTIIRALHACFPGDPILSEESADSSEPLAADRLWIVDPLDGTKEFLAQNGEFAVMIGLAVAGEAVLGVVYLPEDQTLYGAARGMGAWVERDGKRRPLLRAPLSLDATPRLLISRSHADPVVAEIKAALRINAAAPCGSVGVKCSRIAADTSDLYVHTAPYLKEWDTCAPEVLVREAGGIVSDCLGQPLRYNKPNPMQPHGMMAAAPGLFMRVQPTVAALSMAAAGGTAQRPPSRAALGIAFDAS